MFQVLAIASNALVVQGRKLSDIASAIAATDATPSSGGSAPDSPAAVRIGSLPVGDPVENMVSLKEVELAYRMNAAVIQVADEMFDALLDTIHSDER
ncbi:flagellar basal body rod C-terminal domain-containing protein [Hyphomicrobium sp.]|uniref:flagellar basal body rod C-terminal domain-containing protein n=1 Tax=Hyphomicrobium sp. TaxID=82 RepID=UPI0025C4A7C6|nr:flagellar basal body rod C-terminal domain-containing protein [Hyphomicrobium sp.]MCC7252927.1 hypothetical protein [Hyphomicrobium sp.]